MSDAKAIRKQVRNVCQETLPEIMKSVLGDELKLQVDSTLKTRLDGVDAAINLRIEGINQYCIEQLAKQDKRSKDVQGFLMGQVRGHIRNTMNDMDVTIEAIIGVLGSAGIAIENFGEKVIEQKKAVVARREDEAKAQMEAELKAQQEAEKTDAAPAETPATPSEA
jgi:hypothetical protein